jgi:hypothetical protein
MMSRGFAIAIDAATMSLRKPPQRSVKLLGRRK